MIRPYNIFCRRPYKGPIIRLSNKASTAIVAVQRELFACVTKHLCTLWPARLEKVVVRLTEGHLAPIRPEDHSTYRACLVAAILDRMNICLRILF